MSRGTGNCVLPSSGKAACIYQGSHYVWCCEVSLVQHVMLCQAELQMTAYPL